MGDGGWLLARLSQPTLILRSPDADNDEINQNVTQEIKQFYNYLNCNLLTKLSKSFRIFRLNGPMFVQCFVNINYDGGDHFGGICKIGDNFSTLILLKVIVKSLDDNKHIGSASFMIFLGAGPEDLHTSPWFVWSGLTSTLAFLSALLLYKILKARCVTYSLIFGIFCRLLLLCDY